MFDVKENFHKESEIMNEELKIRKLEPAKRVPYFLIQHFKFSIALGVTKK